MMIDPPIPLPDDVKTLMDELFKACQKNKVGVSVFTGVYPESEGPLAIYVRYNDPLTLSLGLQAATRLLNTDEVPPPSQRSVKA